MFWFEHQQKYIMFVGHQIYKIFDIYNKRSCLIALHTGPLFDSLFTVCDNLMKKIDLFCWGALPSSGGLCRQSNVMEDWRIFCQNAILVPHPLGRNDFLHGRHVNDVVRSVEERRHLMRNMRMTVSVLLLLDHRLAILPLLLAVRNVMVGRLVLDLTSLAPNAADLEIVAVGRQCVGAGQIVVVLSISPQHPDGEQNEQDEDASAGDGDGDSGRLEPQIVTAASANCWAVSVQQPRLHGNGPQLNAWNTTKGDNHVNFARRYRQHCGSLFFLSYIFPFSFFFYFSSSLHTPITEIFIFFFPSVSAGTPTLMIEGRAD